MTRQALFALVLIMANAVYLHQALALPRPFAHGEPGPAFLPLILSAILFLACGRILIGALRGAGGEEEEAEEEGVSARALLVAGLTALFILGFEPLGYWPATLAYAFAVAFLFEREGATGPARAAAISAAISLGVTLAGWLFFVRLFELQLPAGAF